VEGPPHFAFACFTPLPVLRRCLFLLVILSASFEREGPRRTPPHPNPPPLSPVKSPPLLFLTPYPLPLFSCQDPRSPKFPLTHTNQTT
jgi:hypothetical protein